MDQQNIGNKKRKAGVPPQTGQSSDTALSAPVGQLLVAAHQQTTATNEDGFAVPQRSRDVHPRRVWPD